MVRNRSSYSARDVIELVRALTKTVQVVDITAEIETILMNSAISRLTELLEPAVFPFLLKRSGNLTLVADGTSQYYIDITEITDFKRALALFDTTSKRVIEFKTLREFQNIKQSGMYATTPYAMVHQGTIYIWAPSGANITSTTIQLDYIRQVDKVLSADIMSGSGTEMRVRTVTNPSGGTGFVVGDLLKPNTGTVSVPGQDAVFRASSVIGGAITGLELLYQGRYTVFPSTTALVKLTGSGAGSPVATLEKNTYALDIPDEHIGLLIADLKASLLEMAGKYQEANNINGINSNVVSTIFQAYGVNNQQLTRDANNVAVKGNANV